MKKAKPTTVESYLDTIPASALPTFTKLRATIRSAVPKDAIEVISYSIPAFRHHKVLVWFAAFSNHCSLFPTAEIIDAFKTDLKPFTISKGTIQFPLDKPLPTALIKKIVKARVAAAGIRP